MKARAEDGRVAVRNVRRHVRQELEHLEKDGEISQRRPRPHREGAREADPRRDRRDRHDARATRRRSCSRSDAPEPAGRERRSGRSGRVEGDGSSLEPRGGYARERSVRGRVRRPPHARRGCADPGCRGSAGRVDSRRPPGESEPDPTPTTSSSSSRSSTSTPDPAEPRVEHRPETPSPPVPSLPCARSARRRRPEPVGHERADDAPATESTDARSRGERPTGEVPPLPHWTEPPTGAVPGDLRRRRRRARRRRSTSWATVTGRAAALPRRGLRLGRGRLRATTCRGEHDEARRARRTTGPVDEEAAFARDLAERRRGPRAGPRARPTTAPPAPPVAARGPSRGRAPSSRRGRGRRPRPADRDHDRAAVAVVAIICFTQRRRWTALLAAVIVGVATLEFASALQQRGLRPATLARARRGARSCRSRRSTYGADAYPGVLRADRRRSRCCGSCGRSRRAGRCSASRRTVLVFAYVGGLGGFAGLLLASSDGVGLILGVALCVIAYDVVRLLRRLAVRAAAAIAPRVSPNKTVEGTVAGMVASVVVGAAIVGQIDPWTVGQGAVLGVLRRGRRVPRRPVRVDAQARPRPQGLRLAAARPRRACSTGSTRCCSACRSPTTSRSSLKISADRAHGSGCDPAGMTSP